MLIVSIFLLLGLIHLAPALVAVSRAQLTRLYGIQADDGLMLALLQHRAILLGLVGEAFIAGAFIEAMRWPALIGGITSMASFLIIAALRRQLFGKLRLIVLFDVAGLALAAIALFIMLR